MVKLFGSPVLKRTASYMCSPPINLILVWVIGLLLRVVIAG
jgi:hypothetical protein